MASRKSTVADDPLQLAEQAFQQGFFHQAIALWEPRAVQDATLHPKLAAAYDQLANHPADTSEILSYSERAVHYDPSSVKYRYRLARRYHRMGLVPQALEQYQQLLPYQADLPHLHLLIVVCSLSQQSVRSWKIETFPVQFQPALRMVQHFLQRNNPSFEMMPNPLLWEALWAFHSRQPEAGSLLAAFQPTTPIERWLRQVYLGLALLEAGDWQKGIDYCFQPPTGTSPIVTHDSLFLFLQQQILRLQQAGQLQAAATLARKLLQFDPHMEFQSFAVIVLAQAAQESQQQGQLSQAIQQMHQALLFAESFKATALLFPLRHNVALLYEQDEDWEEAADLWSSLLRSKPRRVKSSSPYTEQQWQWIAQRMLFCYRMAGRFDRVVQLLRTAVKHAPEDLATRIELVDALLQNQQLQAARNEVERVLSLNARYQPALIRSAAIYLVVGEHQPAIRILDPLAREHPTDPELYSLFGTALLSYARQLFEAMQYSQAEAVCLRGMQHNPRLADFSLMLARIAALRRQIPSIEQHLHHFLEVTNHQLAMYMIALELWVSLDQLEAAQQLLNQAGEHGLSQRELYLAAAEEVCRQFPAYQRFPRKRQKLKRHQRWHAWSDQLLRAVLAHPAVTVADMQQVVRLYLNVDSQLALECATQALKHYPEDLELRLLLLLAQWQLHQQHEVQQSLQQIRQLAQAQAHQLALQRLYELTTAFADPFFREMLAYAPFTLYTLRDGWLRGKP